MSTTSSTSTSPYRWAETACGQDALVLALIDGLAAAATRQAASGVTPQLRSETHNAVLALLKRGDA